jgi:hypothetical protein
MNGFEFAPSYWQLPVGSIIQAAFNLSSQNYLRCDGSVVLRASYPTLAAQLPNVGVFTPVIRIQASNPQYIAGACSVGATVVAPAASGTLTQYSTNNGVTWTAGPAVASALATHVINTGVNFVAACAGVVPYYSATGTSGWNAATGAAVGTNQNCYAATNGAGAVLLCNGNNQVYSSSNNGTSYTTVTTAAGGNVMGGSPVVYAGGSGTTWIIFGYSSSVGVGMQTAAVANGPWTAVQSLPWGGASIASACSDGAGNVLAVIGGSSIAWVSNNSGVTWREVLLPLSTSAGAANASFANGRWFVALGSGDFACSSDTYSWSYIPAISIGLGNCIIVNSGANYCVVSLTGIATMTEDATKMCLPTSRRSYTVGGTMQIVSVANWQEWIKVQ